MKTHTCTEFRDPNGGQFSIDTNENSYNTVMTAWKLAYHYFCCEPRDSQNSLDVVRMVRDYTKFCLKESVIIVRDARNQAGVGER
jgi:hypothetical protein